MRLCTDTQMYLLLLFIIYGIYFFIALTALTVFGVLEIMGLQKSIQMPKCPTELNP